MAGRCIITGCNSNLHDEHFRVSVWWEGAEERLRARGAGDRTINLCRSMFYGGVEATLATVAKVWPEGPYTEREFVMLDELLEDMSNYKKEYMDPTKD